MCIVVNLLLPVILCLQGALDIGETIGVAVLGRRDIAHRRRASHLSLEQHNNTADENGTCIACMTVYSCVHIEVYVYLILAEDTESLTSSSSSIKKKTQDHPIIYALKGLKPFDYQTWKEEGIVWKVLDICKVHMNVVATNIKNMTCRVVSLWSFVYRFLLYSYCN